MTTSIAGGGVHLPPERVDSRELCTAVLDRLRPKLRALLDDGRGFKFVLGDGAIPENDHRTIWEAIEEARGDFFDGKTVNFGIVFIGRCVTVLHEQRQILQLPFDDGVAIRVGDVVPQIRGCLRIL